MEGNRKELERNEMEQASGGSTNPIYCAHLGKYYTGETKMENGHLMFAYRCNTCGKQGWTDDEPGGGAVGGW